MCFSVLGGEIVWAAAHSDDPRSYRVETQLARDSVPRWLAIDAQLLEETTDCSWLGRHISPVCSNVKVEHKMYAALAILVSIL